MTEFFRAWLLSITAAALLVAAAESLLPNGTVKKIGRLTGGLILMLAIIQPLLKLDTGRLSERLTEYKAAAGEYGPALDEANHRLMKAIIEEKTAAYIEEKADALGIVCTAKVSTKTGEGDYPYPSGAVITGSLTEAEKQKLRAALSRELAIPEEQIKFLTQEKGR